MSFARPDRSDYTPNFRRAEDDPVIDIGWAEGALCDGRPYRMECWAEEQVTVVTFFFAQEGLADLGDEGFASLLEAEGLVTYMDPGRYHGATASPMIDAAGNALWSVSVVVGDDEQTFVETRPIGPYATTPGT